MTSHRHGAKCLICTATDKDAKPAFACLPSGCLTHPGYSSEAHPRTESKGRREKGMCGVWEQAWKPLLCVGTRVGNRQGRCPGTRCWMIGRISSAKKRGKGQARSQPFPNTGLALGEGTGNALRVTLRPTGALHQRLPEGCARE